jgi:hypothetical protein
VPKIWEIVIFEVSHRALHGTGSGVRDDGTRFPRDPRESRVSFTPGAGWELERKLEDGMGTESRLSLAPGTGWDGTNIDGCQSRISPVLVR